MKSTRRQFLQTSALSAAAAAIPPAAAPAQDSAESINPRLDAFEIARRHLIVKDVPGPNFFEGSLLGNGDVGVCVVVRPDALGLHLAKSDSWDIRVSEGIKEYILSFQDLLKLWRRASDEAKRLGKPDMLYLENNISFFREYTEKVAASYRKPWPRPWPCGTVWIHWDPRWMHAGRQTLDPSNGLFTLELGLNQPNQPAGAVKLLAFVDWSSGLVSVSTDGPAPFLSIDYYPEVGKSEASHVPSAVLPPPEITSAPSADFIEFSSFQHFPAIGPTEEMPSPPPSDKDRNCSVYGRIAGRWSPYHPKALGIGVTSQGPQRLRVDLKLATPRDILLARLEQQAAARGDQDPWIIISQDHAYTPEDLDTKSYARKEVHRLAQVPVSQIRNDTDANWRNFWSHSAVALEDPELERIWYHNQYFLACCLRARKTAPGLFGNWATGGIGTAWHSDYHMDYNCQQVYWGVFSSNHVEQHLPYVELCQNLMPMSEAYARDKFGLPGAYFPHSAYPAPSQMVPYPVPPWGYQISETPWTVQSLWWQYLYTQDADYLRKVYPILRAAARFVAAYVKKGDDGKYHFIPTVSSENWGCTVDFRLNQDCILDISLSQFLLAAVIEASSALSEDETERMRWKEILKNLAPYPKAEEPRGEVWLDVKNAPTEWIYNVPITLAPIFPAEQVGIGRGEDQLEIARRTARLVRLEGGNDLVFQPMVRARLAMLDLQWFKGQVRYCLLPDGIANDRVRQTGGRYSDSTNFDFMMHMGVWTENLSLPGVLNECMLQSYSGTIHLFPNTQNLGPARFQDLRAAGAFLVSAGHNGKQVTHIRILSEKGRGVRLAPPWPGVKIHVRRARDSKQIPAQAEEGVFTFPTEPGEEYQIAQA